LLNVLNLRLLLDILNLRLLLDVLHLRGVSVLSSGSLTTNLLDVLEGLLINELSLLSLLLLLFCLLFSHFLDCFYYLFVFLSCFFFCLFIFYFPSSPTSLRFSPAFSFAINFYCLLPLSYISLKARCFLI